MARKFQANDSKGVLARLLKDQSGNTLALVAASLIPLTAIIGGSVDISRIYMAKSRLQAACDAGALAGRRIMSEQGWTLDNAGNANRDSSAERQAKNYFYANFEQGRFDSKNLSVQYGEEDGLVTGSASVELPMAVMALFDKSQSEITVNCDAEINLSNTDIMFVLDVTGSMADCPNGSNCNSNSSSKIVGLRNAVMDFYDELEPTVSDDAQLRYGFVPYAANVNVGNLLYDANPSWIAANNTYQSRVWRTTTLTPTEWDTPSTTWGSASGDRNISYPSGSSYLTITSAPSGYLAVTTHTKKSDCESTSKNPVPPKSTPVQWKADTSVIDSDNVSTTTGIRTTVYDVTSYYERYQYKYTWTGSPSKCRLQRRTYRYEIERTRTDVSNPTVWEEETVPGYWVYRPLTYPTATYAATINGGAAAVTQTGDNGTNVSSTWNGCIEERQTVADSSFDPISANALDLDIDMVPTSDEATKWKPSWPNILYERPNTANTNVAASMQTNSSYDRASHSCVAAAWRLSNYDRDAVQGYVNGLVANGNTYHDIGMLWGARLLSPTGLFASDNDMTPEGAPIDRHIIFMTDGLLVPNTSAYGTYGYERLDKRVTGSAGTGSAFDRHTARFEAICRAARNKSITIWSIGFGVDVPDTMYRCANDDPNNKESATHTFQADSSEQLADVFKGIAGKIGELRLKK